MARSKGIGSKRKAGCKKGKAVKKSNFSFDRQAHPINPPGSGLPSNYLYGAAAAKATKKKSLKSKRRGNRINDVQSTLGPILRKSVKRPLVQLQIVDSCSGPVPWWKTVESRNGDRKRSKRQLRLPNGFLVEEESLQHLNEELQSFATYVKLNGTERDARNCLVENVKGICQHLFGIEGSQCEIFGSFASPDVCVFGSDVDVAIWGVVPTMEDDNAHEEGPRNLPSSQEKRPNIASVPNEVWKSVEEERAGASNIHQNKPYRTKKQKVLKWISLLDEGIEEMKKATNAQEKLTRDDEGSDDDHYDDAAPSHFDRIGEGISGEIESLERSRIYCDKSRNDGETQQSLFVLDRLGRKDLGESSQQCQTGCESWKAHNEDTHSESEAGKDEGNVKRRKDELDENEDDSEDDSADKLESLWSRLAEASGEVSLRRRPAHPLDADTYAEQKVDDVIDEYDNQLLRRRSIGQSTVSLSSATTCSDDGVFDDFGMEVSFTVESSPQRLRKTDGPTGRSRTAVVNALYKIAKRLRPLAATLHVRKKARVPIINFQSHFGFECDIVMGGHNGADTCRFATLQMAKFKSFSAIVLVLKIILREHSLDKPFTGGLGSFSLYVLVAYHLEKHLAMGGNDDPAEGLYAFFHRYGSGGFHDHEKETSLRTHLSQEKILQTSDGAAIDMGSCYQVQSLVKLFGLCRRALHRRLGAAYSPKESILQAIVNPRKLEVERSKSKRQAAVHLSATKPQNIRNDSSSFANIPVPQKARRKTSWEVTDEEAKQLIESYRQDVDEFMVPDHSIIERRASGNHCSTPQSGRTLDKFVQLEQPLDGKVNKPRGKRKATRINNKRRKIVYS